MFHVEFLVDDKHLVKMHHALHGLRLFNLDVQPVANAKVKGGKVKEADIAPMTERILPALRSSFPKNGQRITRIQIFETVRKLGGTPYSQQIQALVKAKQLKRVGHATYTLTGVK